MPNNPIAVWHHNAAPKGVEIPEGFRVVWFYDLDYNVDENIVDDLRNETRQALDSGELVAVGYVVEDTKTGEQYDSLWGILPEWGLVEAFRDNIVFPNSLELAEQRFKEAEAALKEARNQLVEARIRAVVDTLDASPEAKSVAEALGSMVRDLFSK